MRIIHDFDPSLRFETNGIFRRLFNSIFIPILNLLPSSANRFVKKSHKSVEEVVDNATTHKALEVLYKKGHKKHNKSPVHWVVHGIWFNMANSRGVRNRLKIVIRELEKYFQSNTDLQCIKILSIASGSARAVVEAVNKSKILDRKKVDAVFLDKNPHALEYSKELISSTGLINNSNFSFTHVNGTAGTFLNSTKDKFNVIEMVGLLDYFHDDKATLIFSQIRNILEKDGMFITANIVDNPEKKFLTKVVGWDMIYRYAEHLGDILVRAGFNRDEIKLYYEPLKVHVVAVVTKK